MVLRSHEKQVATDAVIIGGGPAGLAAAISMRAKGIECAVIDALEPPIDKGCGEGLLPDAVSCLKTLGIELADDDGHSLRGIRFANNTHRVQAKFTHGTGMGVRRTRLHQKMCERAREAGADLLWGSRATLLQNGRILINGQAARYRWVIGADGASSLVRKWSGLHGERAFSQRYGCRRHYEITPWSEYVEVHWGSTGQLYITPTGRNEVCVVHISRDGNLNRDTFLEGFPEIAARLKDAPMRSSQRGAVSVTRKLKRVANDTVALIGDASGSVDSITGEGLALCFRQAIALAGAVERDNLIEYANEHAGISRLAHNMARMMLCLNRWPALERRSLKALASEQSLFQDLLSVHTGAAKMLTFAFRRGPLFGWKLLSNNS